MLNAFLKARAEQAAIHRVADRLDPAVRRQFLAALEALRDRIDVSALSAALDAGDLVAAERAIAVEGLPDDLQPMVTTLRQVFHTAGAVAAEELSAVLSQAVQFDLTNPRAVAWASRHGSRLVTQISEATREGVRSLIANGIATGRTVEGTAREIRTLVGLTGRQAGALAGYRADLVDGGQAGDLLERRVARYGQQLLMQRARLIARTETIAASSQGQLELWRQAAGDGLLNPAKTRRRWIATEDDRLCPICEALDTQTVPFAGTFRTADGQELDAPPAHPGCLPADTYVSSCGRVSAQFQRWYDGDLLVIRTARGHQLACTPNHPILTNRGWVPAHAVYEVGHVISSRVVEWMTGRRHVYDDYMPSVVQYVAEASWRSEEMAPTPVPVAAEDFHGDGFGSKVAVVWADRLLRNRHDPAREQHRRQLNLARTDIARSTLPTQRHFRTFFDGVFATGRCAVSRLNLPPTLRCGHTFPFQAFRLARRPESHASAFQPKVDGVPSDALLAGELIRGRAGLVAPDEILDVNVRAYSGHVFNLTTATGAYWGNGILTHNCRCTNALEFDQ